MPTYGFEIYWNTPLSCYGGTGSTKAACEAGSCSDTTYTNESSCVAAGETWTQPGIWRGPIAYSTIDVTWNQIGFFTVGANQTASHTYSAAAGLTLKTLQWLLNDIPSDQQARTHTVTVSGVTVSASGGTVETAVLVLGQ